MPRKAAPRSEYSSLAAAVFFTLLFIAMFPIRRLAGMTRLTILVTGLIFLLVIGLVWLAWRRVQAAEKRAATSAGDMPRMELPDARVLRPALTTWQKALRILAYALPCLVAWAVSLWANWPGTLTSNALDQWDQIHNLSLLNDHQPVAGTLFTFLLTRLWDHPAVISIFNMLALALLWGWAIYFFQARGVRQRWLWGITLVFALIPFNGSMLVTPGEDVLSAISIFLLVFLLGQIWLTRGAWLERLANRLLLGLAIGLPFLLSHNGLLVTLLVPVALLLFYPRCWKATLEAAVLALILTLVVRDGLAFQLLKAQPMPTAGQYLVPIHDISAVLSSGGTVNPDSQMMLERLAPLDTWKDSYRKYSAGQLNDPLEVANTPQFLEAVGQNKNSLLRVFFNLARRYPMVVLRSELDRTSMIWQITGPRDEPIVPSVSSFWRGGLYIFMMVFLAAAFVFIKGRDGLILFVPTAAGMLALVAWSPRPDFSSVYPSVLPVFLIALFASRARIPAQGVNSVAVWGALGRNLWAARRRIALLLLASLALASAYRPSYDLTTKPSILNPLAIASRYDCLGDTLPAAIEGMEEVGFHPFVYFHYSPEAGNRSSQQLDWYNQVALARYSLAPAIITNDDQAEWVIAHFNDPEAARQRLKQEGWQIVKDCHNSVFLLHR